MTVLACGSDSLVLCDTVSDEFLFWVERASVVLWPQCALSGAPLVTWSCAPLELSQLIPEELLWTHTRKSQPRTCPELMLT